MIDNIKCSYYEAFMALNKKLGARKSKVIIFILYSDKIL